MPKKPPKDKFMLKERWEIEDLVFDKDTLIALSKAIEKGIFEKLDYLVSMGKEANVYRATSKKNFVAVKIYKKETARFFRRHSYIKGDPRFKRVPDNERYLVELFALKEFKNLKLAFKAGVPAPVPLFHIKNIVVMSFLGEKGLPYPRLIDSNVSTDDFYSIIDNIKALYNIGLIHADISEYNILKGDKNYMIDFGQGVVKEHPMADSLLRRDISNVVKFFRKRCKIDVDVDRVVAYVKENKELY